MLDSRPDVEDARRTAIRKLWMQPQEKDYTPQVPREVPGLDTVEPSGRTGPWFGVPPGPPGRGSGDSTVLLIRMCFKCR